VNLALVSKIPKHKPIFPALIFETAARTAGVTGYLQVGARLAANNLKISQGGFSVKRSWIKLFHHEMSFLQN
jgi:hypothetical protein